MSESASASTVVEPLSGKELLRAAVNQIIKNPKSWDQSWWHGRNACGTTHCVAGWCQVLAGKEETDSAGDQAKRLIGLSGADADWLFSGRRTLGEIHAFAKAFLAGEAYFKDGYDRAGYNRAGYNRDGYDRDGYDWDGYDRDGYDRAGYNRDGYDRAGYDRDGYDRDGEALQPL